ncbi:MAG: SDR family oxidoreductase [Hoeflea sp.]|uniref:SDR family oxidoreductase n=1 Tax=Hoeflea sp. TaxID=1940281 RepID=UPI0032EB1B84
MSDSSKIALVTGSARRIGRAMVMDLAAHGFKVAIHASTSGAEAEKTAGEVRDRGGAAKVFIADLTDIEQIRRLHEEVSEDLGSPDLIVNNASVFKSDDVRKFDNDLFDLHFALHVKAPSVLAEAMANGLSEEQSGLIVNMIDQRVWKLTPRFYSYTLSKSALWTATQTLAQALAPRIRVNAIGPGPTLANERQKSGDFDRQARAVLLNRGPDLSEFGATLRYLYENRSITGQMIALDGGQHLAWETPDVKGVSE